VFRQAADNLDATKRDVEYVAANNSDFDQDGVNSDGNPNTYLWGLTTSTHIYINADVSADNQLATAVHESLYHNSPQNTRGISLDIFHDDGRRRDVGIVLGLVDNGFSPRGFAASLVRRGIGNGRPGWERLVNFVFNP